MVTTFSIIFGLLIGSFLSVCIYRIPLSRGYHLDNFTGDADQPEDPENPNPELKPYEVDGKPISILHPARSFCASCEKQLLWWHNIPLVSWLLMRGRSTCCGKKISFRYPLVEILSALFAFLSFTSYGITLSGFVIYGLSCALIVISFIDYDYFIIPDIISIPGTLLGVIFAAVQTFYPIYGQNSVPPLAADIYDSLLGILFGGGFLWFISAVYLRLRKREGLGFGDVKLLAMTGAWFGMHSSIYSIFVGSFLGSVIGLMLILIVGKKASQYIPFGPYLALGTLAYIFADRWVIIPVLRLLGE